MKLKWYYVAWAVFAIILCAFVAAGMGSTFYATVSNQPGPKGHIYESYGISKAQYAAYTFIVAAIAAILGLLHLRALRTNNQKLMTRLIIAFLLFAAAHLAFEFRFIMQHLANKA